MGGKKCLNDEERRLRKNAAALNYYHKNKDKLLKDENYKERRRIGSLKYYHKNKQKCVDSVLDWRLRNPLKYKRIQQKAYYKRMGKIVIFIKKKSIEKA
tara:strand:+ start:169 stop:465 length:297 start_codon:yes stop_codon:yes gene_type:complete